jgi:hypothetical protein
LSLSVNVVVVAVGRTDNDNLKYLWNIGK